MTIMTVDDSATMRKIVGVTLTSAGHTVVEAENGQDALDKLPGKNIELFIVDINMPVMNGIDFVSNLRRVTGHEKTPVIILTTENEQNMIEKGKQAGANAWIIKPFESEELMNLISHFGG